MIAVVRIAGRVKLRKDVIENFQRIGIKRKYSCAVFLNPTPEQMGMVIKAKDLVAYGEINKETYEELVKARGRKTAKKETGKVLFRLHPPRGGINTKKHFPKGILGNNKEKINDLIRRML